MRLIVGDIIKLKPRYRNSESSGLCMVIMIESFQGPGWIAYDYIAMLTTGQLTRITEGCVEEIYSTC